MMGFLAARTGAAHRSAILRCTRVPRLLRRRRGLDTSPAVGDPRLGASGPQVIEAGTRLAQPRSYDSGPREIIDICRRCGAASADHRRGVQSVPRAWAPTGTAELIQHPPATSRSSCGVGAERGVAAAVATMIPMFIRRGQKVGGRAAKGPIASARAARWRCWPRSLPRRGRTGASGRPNLASTSAAWARGPQLLRQPGLP